MGKIETTRLQRSSVLVFFALLRTHGEATYRGIQLAMGLETSRAARRAVRVAVIDGVARVVSTGGGRGAKSVVKLTPDALEYARRIFPQ